MPAILKTRTVGFLGSAGYTGSLGYTGSYDGNANFSGFTGSTVPSVKTSPLENREIDWNFIALNNIKLDYNGSGAALTNLNAGNISSGTLAVARGGTGQTTYTDGQLLIGNTSGNTLTKATLTAGSNIAITNGNGSISIAISATPSFTTITTTGNDTVGGDLAVNGGDITTTATTFNFVNSNATTLNVGQAATTISIGATTGTATVRNATLAVTNALTVGTTLAVTGNTTLTGTLAVNGGSITTSATTFNHVNTTATTVNAYGAATALTLGATTGTATIRNATVAVTNALTVGTTLAVTGNTTLTGDIAVNGGDITTTATTFNHINTTATTVNAYGAATALTLGATTGTATIRNATTAITGNATVGGTLGVTGNSTFSDTITHGAATMAVPTGSAPIFAPRAWGKFNGVTSVTPVSGTYSQSGTTVTVSITGHGLAVGDIFHADITSGTGVDGWYTVVTSATNSFTYTAGTSLTTSGNISLNRRTLAAGGNIKSIIARNNAAVQVNGSGIYAVNFITDMPDANYAVIGSASFADTVSGGNGLVFHTIQHTVHGFIIITADNNADNPYDATTISFTVMR